MLHALEYDLTSIILGKRQKGYAKSSKKERMGHIKVPKYRKIGTHEGPKSIQKNVEHMKAHRENKLAMSWKSLRSNQTKEYISTKFHTLAQFWSKSMTLLSSEIQDLTLQRMQGKCATTFSFLPKNPR